MARHGECFEVEILKRKIPDLGDIKNPYAFIEFMRRKGYTVTFSDIGAIRGKMVKVEVPEKDLAPIFISPELCVKPEDR